MKRRYIILLSILAIVGIVLFIWTNKFHVPKPVPSLPDFNEIESLTAEIVDDNQMFPRIPAFEIPKQCVPFMLNAFKPIELADEHFIPTREMPLGKLTISTKTGSVTIITFYFLGKNPLPFTLNGGRYQRGGMYEPIRKDVWAAESNLLAGIIVELHKEKKSSSPSTGLQQLFDDLERSRGERPPR